MVTRKKSQQTRTGLLHGPSRKQIDITNNPDAISRSKSQSTLSFDGLASGVSTTTVYTCPEGKTARLTFLTAILQPGESSFTVFVGTPVLATWANNNTSVDNLIPVLIFPYEVAPLMLPGESLRLANFDLGSQVNYSVRITEEEI